MPPIHPVPCGWAGLPLMAHLDVARPLPASGPKSTGDDKPQPRADDRPHMDLPCPAGPADQNLAMACCPQPFQEQSVRWQLHTRSLSASTPFLPMEPGQDQRLPAAEGPRHLQVMSVHFSQVPSLLYPLF